MRLFREGSINMSWKSAAIAALTAVAFAVVVGCDTGGPSGHVPPAGAPNKDTPTATSSDKTAADDLPGLKDLSPEDRKLAEKQKYCPKTGELLGSMGTPYKIKLKGREFFLCCDGCEAEVRKDPDKYLKKLDQLLAKK